MISMNKKGILAIATIILVAVTIVCVKQFGGDGKTEKKTERNSETEKKYDEINNQNPDVDSQIKTSGEMSEYMNAISSYFERECEPVNKGYKIITFPMIYYVDKKESGDIKVYGIFRTVEYNIINNQIQMFGRGGGDNTGVCILQNKNDGYDVLEFEEAGDGQYFIESIDKYQNDIGKNLSPSLKELMCDNTDMDRLANIILYKHAVNNGFDITSYKNYDLEETKLDPINMVKIKDKTYYDTGICVYDLEDATPDIKIENVTQDIEKASEENVSNFKECEVKNTDDEKQVLVKYDGLWHVFEK